jgi:RHS repeat-associated protein
VNGASTAYSYDADGLLSEAGALALTRDPTTGFVTRTQIANLATAATYDAFGALIHQDAGPLYALDLVRDAAGRVTSKTETLGGATAHYAYGYDVRGRLTSVDLEGAPLSRYTFDANGNRIAAFVRGATVSATYDAQDRLLSYGSTTYTYSPSGDLATRTSGGQTTTYTYDAFGSLVSAAIAGGARVDYRIDGLHRRVGKRLNGAPVQGFLYLDALRPAAELDGQGNVVSTFVYAGAPNVPELVVKPGGATYRLLKDPLGSVRLVVNAQTGAIAQRLDYDEWGNIALDTNPGFQPFDFAGGLYDRDTHLVRFGARDYDPESGRWTAKDPLNLAGGDPNLYAHALTDPINLLDATGLLAFDDFGADAALWWADRYNESGAWYDAAGGLLASLWTPETSGRTAAVLLVALGAAGTRQISKGPGEPAGPRPPGCGPGWEWRYPENNRNGGPRWFDPEGGEWRYHEQDRWHPEGHWDNNPWETWNSPWRNVPQN